MNKLKVMIAGMLISVLFCGMVLTGCSANPSPENESSGTAIVSDDVSMASIEQSSSEPEPTYRKVGTEDANAFAVLINNKAGQEITGIAIKSSNDNAYPDSIFSGGQPIEKDETLQLFYTPSDTGEDEETANVDPEDPDTAVAFTVTYDIRLTFADETVLELYDFAFQDIAEADLCVEDGVAFVKYESKKTGESVDTKNAQLAAKEKVEEEEAKAAAAKASSQASSKSSTKSNSKSSSKSKSKASSKSKPSQNTDECLDDNIAWND